MKSTIVFNLPEDREELNDALNGSKYKSRIDTLYDRVFRPHLKHEKPIMEEGSVLSPEEYDVIHELWKKTLQHFEDCLDD